MIIGATLFLSDYSGLGVGHSLPLLEIEIYELKHDNKIKLLRK